MKVHVHYKEQGAEATHVYPKAELVSIEHNGHKLVVRLKGDQIYGEWQDSKLPVPGTSQENSRME